MHRIPCDQCHFYNDINGYLFQLRKDGQAVVTYLFNTKIPKEIIKGELTSESDIYNMKKGENNIDFYVILRITLPT